LRHFGLAVDSGVAARSPLIGPVGLETFRLKWLVRDGPTNPESAIHRLNELFRPSLNTLVRLELLWHDLDTPSSSTPVNCFDLRSLAAAGKTLRIFRYETRLDDVNILEIISEILPHLAELSLTYHERDNAQLVKWTVHPSLAPM
jgi:hypothetical protein